MGRDELRYLYIGSVVIAAWTALSGGAFPGAVEFGRVRARVGV